MESDLLLLLLFFFVIYCGDTIYKAVSTLFSAIATLCFYQRYPVMILRLYAGPSSIKNRSTSIEVFSEKDVLRIFTLVLKNGNEGVALKSLLKLNNSQVFFVYFLI